jgi:hypothetical protein
MYSISTSIQLQELVIPSHRKHDLMKDFLKSTSYIAIEDCCKTLNNLRAPTTIQNLYPKLASCPTHPRCKATKGMWIITMNSGVSLAHLNINLIAKIK